MGWICLCALSRRLVATYFEMQGNNLQDEAQELATTDCEGPIRFVFSCLALEKICIQDARPRRVMRNPMLRQHMDPSRRIVHGWGLHSKSEFPEMQCSRTCVPLLQ
jgi:hypothetical protein